MKAVTAWSAVLLAGCSTSTPILYDGQRHVTIHCQQAAEHVSYLQREIDRSHDLKFISDTKKLIWNIKFSCP
jgi:hypothetical protein